MKGRYIAGIDLGSTKISLMAGVIGKDGLRLACSVSVASRGLRKGVVVDIDETANSISHAVREARAACGVDIRGAYVGISGGHIKSRESFGATGIKGKEVNAGDIERVIDSASTIYVPLDREVMHVLPSEFIIDGQDGILRPFGMAGVRLEAKVQVVTASQAALENLGRALERSGLRALEIVFQPLAGGMAVLKDDELQQGVLLIDMGGGTTDIALFKGGSLRWAGVIPVGGAHTTNDIAVGLQLPQKEAERLKRRYGLGPEKANLFETGEGIEAKSMSGKAKQITQTELARIIRLRTEELFELVKNEAGPQIIRHQPLCAVITGGASQTMDIASVAERWFGLPVRIGLPERVPLQSGQFAEALRDPRYAGAAGLLLYGFEAEGGADAVQRYSFAFPDSIGLYGKTVIEEGMALAKKFMGKVRRFEWGANE